VQPREGDEVDSHFPQIRIQLTWESDACSDTCDGGTNQMVQVSIGRSGEFEGSEANVVQGFVVNDLNDVGILYQLMDGQSGVLGFDHSV